MDLDAPSRARGRSPGPAIRLSKYAVAQQVRSVWVNPQFTYETMKNGAERNLYRAQTKLYSFHSAIGDFLRRRAKFTQPVTGI